jgi:hypothetical protein
MTKSVNNIKRNINKLTTTILETQTFPLKDASQIPDAKGIKSLTNGYLNQHIILQHISIHSAAR